LKSKQEIIFKDLFKIPIKNGLFKPTRVRGSGTKMINMGEIFAIDRIFDVPMELVPLTDNEEKNAIIEKNDLIFARSSLADGAGKCSIFLGNEKTTFESHIIRVRINPKIANSKFYYYYFNSSFGKNSVYSITEKTAASGIRGSDLANLIVPFPNKDTQDNVANQLENLDTKIENLQNQNHTLEQIAHVIFKSWFVDFDGVTEWDDSELGKIPKGWSSSLLSEYIQIKKGKKPKVVVDYPKEGYVPQILIETLNGGKFSYADPKNMITSNVTDTIMVMDGISSGRVSIGYDGIIGSTLAKLTSKNNPYFFYFLVKNLESILKLNTTGSAIPHTDKHLLMTSVIIIPTSDFLDKFEEIICKIQKQITKNKKLISVLTKTRDALLPKLMSGEIRV